MAHPRKLIRKAVVALLVGANTAAESRVFPTRVPPIRKTELPAIAVYTEDEETDQDSMTTAPRELKRDVDMSIELFVANSDGYSIDDAMDDLAEQVEAAMNGNRYLSGTASESVLAATESGVAEGSADPLIGISKLTYRVTYRSDTATGVANDDFLRVDAKYQVVGGVSDTHVDEDTFSVRSP